MQEHILDNFYKHMLPLFHPQAEKVLKSIQPAALNSLSFRYTFSVEAMIEVSHIIEDAVLNTPNTGELHVSFQYLSRVLPQQQRYRAVARAAKTLWLYGVQDAVLNEILPMPNVVLLGTDNTPLIRYWYVVAYGPGLSMTLLAEEISALMGGERYYEGFYTFEPVTAYQFISVLHQIYPDQVPVPTEPTMFERI